MTLETKYQEPNGHLRVLSALHHCTHGDAGPGEICARNGLPRHGVVWPMAEGGDGTGKGGCNEDGMVILAGYTADAERNAMGGDKWDKETRRKEFCQDDPLKKNTSCTATTSLMYRWEFTMDACTCPATMATVAFPLLVL